MLASYQDVFPTDFLPSVLKRSHVWLPVWSVCGMQRTNLVYLLHNLLFFPCSESKGPMWSLGGEVRLALRLYWPPWEKKSAANNGGRLRSLSRHCFTKIAQNMKCREKNWDTWGRLGYNQIRANITFANPFFSFDGRGRGGGGGGFCWYSIKN